VIPRVLFIGCPKLISSAPSEESELIFKLFDLADINSNGGFPCRPDCRDVFRGYSRNFYVPCKDAEEKIMLIITDSGEAESESIPLKIKI